MHSHKVNMKFFLAYILDFVNYYFVYRKEVVHVPFLVHTFSMILP